MKPLKTLLIIMSLSSLLAWFGSCKSNQSITSVPAAEFRSEIQSHNTQLVDVRTPEEFDESHISGAVNIDVKSADFMPRAMQSLSKERPVYVYCRSGRRSLPGRRNACKERISRCKPQRRHHRVDRQQSARRIGKHN